MGDGPKPAPMRPLDPLMLPLSLAAVIGASHLMVGAAVSLAARAGVTEWVIGSTIVAFGTSVPEFATSLMAVIKKRNSLSLGNLIGSNIFNVVFILGVAGTITPLTIDLGARLDILFMIIITVIVYVLAMTARTITRLEGAILFVLGLAVWVYGFVR